MGDWSANRKRWTGVVMASVLTLGQLLPFVQSDVVHADAATHVVISEVYGGGGNANASYTNDFIELYNPTDSPVDLKNWSVQYASATGTSYQKTNLTGIIPAHGYYLVQEASNAAVGAAMPAPDDSGTIAMAAGAFKVALIDNQTTLSGAGIPAGVVDYVGAGTTANAFEGHGYAPVPSATLSVQRKSNNGNDPVADNSGNGWDTDNNDADFVALTPNPQNKSDAAEPPLGGGPVQTTALAGSTMRFNKADDVNGTLTGEASALASNATINVYSAASGGDSLAATTAGTDGTFTISDPALAGLSSVYVTATAADKAESARVEIKAAVKSADLSGLTYVKSGTTGTLTGTTSTPSARVYVYTTSDASSANLVKSTVSGSTKSFSISLDNQPDTLYVTQLEVTDNGQNFESTPVSVTKLAVPADAIAIATLRASDANGYPTSSLAPDYIIEGVATVDNQILGTQANNYYIQDETGGINIFGGTAPTEQVKAGDVVRLTGKLAFYNGLLEFTPSKTEKIGTKALPAAVPMTVTDLTVYASAEPVEGKLAEVTGTVTAVAASGANYNVTFQDLANTSKTTTVRVISATGINVSTQLVAGQSYTIIGIVSQFDSSSPYTTGYQLFPRSSSDVIPALTLTHTALTETLRGADTVFTAKASGAASVTVKYRATGSSGAYTDLPMTSANQSDYAATLLAADLPDAGLDYYIEAVNGDRVKQSGTSAAPNHVNVINDAVGPDFGAEKPEVGSRVENFKPTISLAFSDPSGVDQTSVSIALDDVDVTPQATVSENGVSYAPAQDLTLGMHKVHVTVKDNRGNKSEQEWTFEVIQVFTGGNHYRGTTHNHTKLSHDAAGTPEDALKAAIAHQYDFFAFSDHSHDLDSSSLGTDSATNGNMPERKGASDWQLTKDLAKQYTKNGQFVVFPAFEMTSTTWGHSNVFGTENFIDRKQDGGKYQDLNQYYAWVLTYDNIVAQFNHPDMSANSFNNFSPYRKDVDDRFTMLEVGNGSGHYGYANAEKTYFKALDLGWHVAPTYGEDNHDGTWGQTTKRTVIVASDLSEASLFDSMKKRRVYMSEDANFSLDFSANGFYMGSVVEGSKLSFEVKGKDPVAEKKSMPEYSYLPDSYQSNDVVDKVELISNGGKVLQTYHPNTVDFAWTPDEVQVTGGQQWYLIKVTQKDGEEIYSSPIWSQEKPVDLKVSTFEAIGGALIEGNPVELQAGISNMGSDAATAFKANFYYDEVDPSNLIGSVNVPDMTGRSTYNAKVTWNNPVLGNHRILVNLVNVPVADDTSDNLFTTAVQVKPSLGITIMIDASHANENTTTDTGTYKDNLKMMTQKLRQLGYTVVENKAAITSSVLSGAKVLFLSHPKTDLTAAENTAIADWVKAGGALFLADKSNFNNNSTINNDLLTEMGSTIQISNDGIFDASKDGNFWSTPSTSLFAVRLHPTPVSNYLTDRVSAVEYYSGSSLEKVGHQPLTDSATVTILARGNETTYQDSVAGGTNVYDNVSNDTGGSAIPAIASEQIGAGRIVVSGMNFINDKQLDETYNTKGNDELGINIFNWLAGRGVTVSTVVDAKSHADDASVVVQGTVTTGADVFFDAFYLQDATGGIMAFQDVPSGSLVPGDRVRVYGKMQTFENNRELIFDKFDTDVVKIGHVTPITPAVVSTQAAASEEMQGLLVKVKGTVVSKYDDNSYVINDGSGPVLVFTDGYIALQNNVPVPSLKAGDTYEAVGLAGKYAEGTRIRVRDTRELVGTPAPEQSSDNTLSSLAVSAGTLNPAFASNVTDYAVAVGHEVTELKVTPTAVAKATVKVNGSSVESGSQSGAIALGLGKTMITIVVKAENGEEKTYTITVTRASNSDNRLTNLAVSTGDLDRAFASNVTEYKLTVRHEVKDLIVTPTTLADATVRVNNIAVESGKQSGAIALAVGETTITIVVKAQNGDERTYTITVIRPKNNGNGNGNGNKK